MIFSFVDLELTQPSRKIIEIGAVAVDFKSNGTSKKMSEFQTYCNPNETITEYITNLTGISDDVVKDAPQIKDALSMFWDWSTANKTSQFIAWGRDMEMLRNASTNLNIYFPNTRELDLKSMSAWFKLIENMPARGGLFSTLENFNLSFDGRQHSALADADNTAKLGMFLFGKISRKK